MNYSWPTGNPPTLSGGSGSVFYGITVPLHWVLACTRFYLCLSRMESMFPPILWKSYNQILLIFQVRSPGDSQSVWQISMMGNLMWGLKPSQQWEKFFGIIVLQIVGHPPGWYGIWFYCILPPLPSHCSFFMSLVWGVSFGGYQHPPVYGYSTASCGFCAFIGDECTFFYSAILNWNVLDFWLFTGIHHSYFGFVYRPP